MSTRWYPLYQAGNPQRRVFLTNFWMKIITTPKHVRKPSNLVMFECSPTMTIHDVKNYLQNIYKIEVIDVRTDNVTGKFKTAMGANYLVKEDDRKLAYITLPKNESFEFPKMFKKEDDLDKTHEQIEELKQDWNKFTKKQRLRKGIPSFFGL